MAAIARKAQLVSDIIKRLFTEKQVEFGDQRLYFKEMIRELEHPFYPEVVVGWTESEAHILSVTDTVSDYSLHEPPILQKKRTPWKKNRNRQRRLVGNRQVNRP